jgi:PAS domain S-box-containing protein
MANRPLDPLPQRSSSSSPAIADALQRLAAIVESSEDAIIGKDLDGIIQTWNRGAERIFGYTAQEAIGQPITIVVPAELQHQEPVIMERIRNGERLDHFETVRQRKNGTRFHISLSISPIRNAEGEIVGASKIGRDISELRRSQESQELLLREMNHRVKNLFAIASGVVALSARTTEDPSHLARDIQSRLAALARAHELILPQWPNQARTTINLAELVRTVLSPYDDANENLTINGPAVECSPSAATSFALLLHEFATNTVKYGAFGKKDGRVSVDWRVAADTLNLSWMERGPTVRKSSEASGFGMRLVDATARSMSATVERSWSDQGLTISVVVPLERVAAQAGARPS